MLKVNFNDFIISNKKQNYITTLIKQSKLKILLHGGVETGKTTLINSIIDNFFSTKDEYTIFRIEQYNDIGINYFRQDVKYFCKHNTKKKKVIIIDNLDFIKESSQHILKNIIETYPKIQYIFSCGNIRKVYESIVSKLYIIQLDILDKYEIKMIIDNYCSQENINIPPDGKNYIIDNYYLNLPSTILNIIKTLGLMDENIDVNLINSISSIVDNNVFIRFFNFLTNQQPKYAVDLLIKVHREYVSIIDLFEMMYLYINTTIELNSCQMNILKILAKYKMYVNIYQEKEIYIYFLTYDIYNEMQKYKNTT